MSQVVLGPPEFLQLGGVITGDEKLQRLVHELPIEYPAVQDGVDGLVNLHIASYKHSVAVQQVRMYVRSAAESISRD